MFEIFVSYSHADDSCIRAIVDHLRVLNTAAVWHDRRLQAADRFTEVITQELERASLALLLISCDFINSEFIRERELPVLLRRQEQGFCKILPLLVRDCAWENVGWLEERVLRPRPLVALAGQTPSQRDETLTRVTREVGYLLRRLQLEQAARRDGAQGRCDQAIQDVDDALATVWDTGSQPVRIETGLAENRKQDLEDVARRRNRQPARVSGSRPREPINSFKDRKREQLAVSEALADEKVRIALIVGRGGMGKTALACRVLHELGKGSWPHLGADQSGPDLCGIAYLSTRTRGITLDRIYTEFLPLLPPDERSAVEQLWARPSASIDEKVIRLLEATQRGLYVVLLDNIEDVLDDQGKLLDPALNRLLELSLQIDNGISFLVTSRRPIVLDSVRPAISEVPLVDGLPLDDATTLFRELLRRDAKAWSSEELERLARRIHGVPRAVEIVAGMILNDPLLSMDELLTDFGHAGFGGSSADSADSAAELLVRDLARQLYGRIDDDAVRVMQALAIYDRPVPVVAVDFLLQPFFPGINVPAVVRRLCKTHLASADRESRRVGLHPIDRDLLHAAIPATGRFSRPELNRAAARYYTTRQVIGVLEWVDIGELDPHVREYQHLLKAGDYDAAALKVGAIANRMTWRGFADRSRALLSEIEGRAQSVPAKIAVHLAECANRTVVGPIWRGILHGKRALRLAKRAGDLRAVAQANWRMAIAYRYSIHGTEAALRHFQDAIDANERAGTPERIPWSLCEVSICYSYLRQGKLALEATLKASSILDAGALERLTAEQRRETLTHVLQAKAFALYSCGNYREAIGSARAALAMWGADQTQNQICSYSLHTIALAHAALLEYDAAKEQWQRANEVALAQGHQRPKAFCEFNLAVLAHLENDDGAAIEHGRAAAGAAEAVRMGLCSDALLDILQRRGDVHGHASALEAVAQSSWDCPDFYGYQLFKVWAEQAALQPS